MTSTHCIFFPLLGDDEGSLDLSYTRLNSLEILVGFIESGLFLRYQLRFGVWC